MRLGEILSVLELKTLIDIEILKLLRCLYCKTGKIKVEAKKAKCVSCSEEFPDCYGGFDLISRETKESLARLIELNIEDRTDCDLSSNNRQHDKEVYENSGYLAKLEKELDLKKGDLKLDAGCGRGHVSECLVKQGYRVLSTDVVPENIQDCGNYSKVLASIDNMPVASEKFDAVLTTDVLEHIYPESQDMVISEFYRVLKPGGKLLVSYPGNKLPAHTGHYLIDAAIFVLRRFNYQIEYLGRGYGGAAHINMRWPWECMAAFKKAGFLGKVVPFQDKFLSLPPKLVPLVRLLNIPVLRMFFVAQMHGLIRRPPV